MDDPSIALSATAISIHALLAESDLFLRSGLMMRLYFYPRSPCGERPHIRSTSPGRPCISIHALLAESDHIRSTSPGHPDISIHALLAESDIWPYQRYFPADISIHALLAESDRYAGVIDHDKPRFLSTLSLRRATIAHLNYDVVAPDFYPRSPCGERRTDTTSAKMPRWISIHALLAESDKTHTPVR